LIEIHVIQKRSAIAGSIAEAYYGAPEEIVAEVPKRLPVDLLDVVDVVENLQVYARYNVHGHKLRFPQSKKA
jgi:hypothetical protein